MTIKRAISGLLLAALGLASAAASYGQEINYGTSQNQGLELENRRYAVRQLDIQKEEVDSRAQYDRDILACSDKGAACRQTAQHDFNVRSNKIETEKVNESATHQKNLIEIHKHWLVAGQ